MRVTRRLIEKNHYLFRMIRDLTVKFNLQEIKAGRLSLTMKLMKQITTVIRIDVLEITQETKHKTQSELLCRDEDLKQKEISAKIMIKEEQAILIK
jgi:hypothetical protein